MQTTRGHSGIFRRRCTCISVQSVYDPYGKIKGSFGLITNALLHAQTLDLFQLVHTKYYFMQYWMYDDMDVMVQVYRTYVHPMRN